MDAFTPYHVTHASPKAVKPTLHEVETPLELLHVAQPQSEAVAFYRNVEGVKEYQDDESVQVQAYSSSYTNPEKPLPRTKKSSTAAMNPPNFASGSFAESLKTYGGEQYPVTSGLYANTQFNRPGASTAAQGVYADTQTSSANAQSSYGSAQAAISAYSSNSSGSGSENKATQTIRPSTIEAPQLAYLIRTLSVLDNSLVPKLREKLGELVSESSNVRFQMAYDNQVLQMITGQSRDWNSEFHSIFDKLTYEFDPVPYKALSAFASEFHYFSEMYARVIVSELPLPNHLKTIPEVEIGGIAGGRKFICNNILFKLAVDSYNIYGGDEFAMKSAAHELKSLTSIIGIDNSNVRLPLMCVIDYLGYRLLAVSLLPINRDTLVYGSSDAGQHVIKSDRDITENMEQIAITLNLKSHRVGVSSVTLNWPVDIEAHRGFDGNAYIVDFARIFPPEAPAFTNEEKPSYARLLRPELVSRFEKPLSSDAFSSFGGDDNKLHNLDVIDATRYLFDTLIPNAAQRLDQLCATQTINPSRLIEEIHRIGVNVRHLGRIRKHAKTDAARALLLTETAARVLKNKLRRKMRRLSSLDEIKDTIVRFCNSFLKECKDIRKFRVRLLKAFPDTLDADERSLCNFRVKTDLVVLFERLEQFLGMHFEHEALLSLNSCENPSQFLFVSADIHSFLPRVKSNPIVHFAEAVVYFAQYKSKNTTVDQKERLFVQASRQFEKALKAAPLDFRTALIWSYCQYHHAALVKSNEQLDLLLRARDLASIAQKIKPECEYALRVCTIVDVAIDSVQRGDAYSEPLSMCPNGESCDEN
jgi:hypothetical protein